MCCTPSVAQDAGAVQAASGTPGIQRPLIVQPVNEAQLTVLKGNTHPLARPEFDLGSAPATLPMQRMLLVLKRSSQQESALKKLLDDQQDKHSPNYHKWLTPEHFGQKFGPSDADIQTISAWLQSHGFQVSPTKGRTVIEFSGSASQVKETFHTAIHKYVVSGEQHWANASDPQIPAALTPAVRGVLTLHNFVKKPQSHLSNQSVPAQLVPGKKPQVTFTQNSKQIHALAPQDYATIYNINPVYNTNNGGPATIGVVGRSNLFNGGTDVQNFRNIFGLCCGTFGIILDGPDPGDLGGGEEAEATLDSTWSGAVAPAASVLLVVSASTNTTDGLDLSEVYILETNLADVMTESFGTCEYFATDADVSGVNNLAEQAAAQGISYFVSTGDTGAESCDDPNFETVATGPLSVNLLASTPFTTAVGGTTFNENGQDSKYWGVSPPVAETALSYIPEDVWNESCLASACGPTNANIWAGSGGASKGNVLHGGTFPGFGKPSWQSGVTGIPNDGARDLPDVSLTSSSHDPYLLCLQGSCVANSQGQFFIYFVWGTSAAAPSFAGIMSLVDNEMARLAGIFGVLRQGLPNYALYRLAAAQSSSLAQCNGSNPTSPPASTCVFNDITVGNNAVPGEPNYGLSSALYQSGVGYDLATGLGSVNVTNLVNQWNTVSFNPTTTTLSLGSLTLTHGSPMPFTITVAPTTGTGVPTGDAFLFAYNGPMGGGGPASLGFFTLNGGSVSSSTGALPGGTYFIDAHYAGDGNFGSSTSVTSSYITVSPEPSTTAVSGPLTQDAFGFYTVPFSKGPFGSPVFVRSDVQGTSGQGVPTGTVTFTDSTGSIPSGLSAPPLNSQGNTSIQTTFFDAGTHTITAAYGADFSFNSSTSAQNPNPALQSVTFTITPGFVVATSPTAVTISSPGASGTTTIGILASTGFSAITFTCSGLPAEASCSPASVTGSGPTTIATATITITTTAPHLTQRFEQGSYYLAHWLTGGGFTLAGVFLIGSPRKRRRAIPMLLIVLAFLVMIPACGGGGSSVHHQQDPGTPLGTYPITIGATGAGVTQSSQFQLVVQ